MTVTLGSGGFCAGVRAGFGRTTTESTSRRAAATSSRRNRAIGLGRVRLFARDRIKRRTLLGWIQKKLETSVRLATCHSASPPPRPPRAGPSARFTQPTRPARCRLPPSSIPRPSRASTAHREGCPRVRATRSPREAAVASATARRAPSSSSTRTSHRRPGVAGDRAARDVRVERRDRQAEDRTRGHQRDRRGESRRDRRDDRCARVVRS